MSKDLFVFGKTSVEADAGGRKLRNAPVRESAIEKHLVKRVKELGGEVRKVKWIGRNGAPDRLVMLSATMDSVNFKTDPPSIRPGRASTTWVELKAPGVKTEPHQLREHERMRKMGQRVVVIDSIEGVEELLS